ncbi:MAG: PQQ-binding-like beta-propeller repeat protein [Planctomycetota bacterium]
MNLSLFGSRQVWRRLATPHSLPVVVAIASAVSLTAGAAAEPTWEVFQLTNGPRSDTFPSVSGTTYVWHQGAFGSTDKKIMKWTEGDPAPLEISDNHTAGGARIDQGRVIWASKSSFYADYEIRLWEAGTITTLTDNGTDDLGPDIGGFGKVWHAFGYLEYDNGQQRFQLSPGIPASYVRAKDSWVVWEAGTEIYFWDNGTQVQLTDNDYGDYRPQTDGNTIVWFGLSSTRETIYRWRPGQGTVQITDDNFFAWQPDVSGDVIVFAGWDGHDYEIFLRYFGVNYQLTNNDYSDEEPNIDGNRVVWQAMDAPGVRHIYYAILSGLEGGDPPGACCAGGTCSLRTATACAAADGVFSGPETFCYPDTCPDGSEPAGGWSTYQHDSARSGRTSAAISSERNRIWSVLVDRPPTNSNNVPTLPKVQPTIAPDGTLYLGRTALSPEGRVRWAILGDGDNASSSVRADGDFWLGTARLNGADGRPVCGSGRPQLPGLLDPEGNAYVASGSSGYVQVRKCARDCRVLWDYDGGGGQGESTPLARGVDGGIHVSTGYFHIKLDPTTGQELWSHEYENRVGAPAIAPDGTIYFHLAPNRLIALSPDGTERWNRRLVGVQNDINAASPAVGADGAVYLATKSQGIPGNEATLVAVAPNGVERWRFTGAPTARAISPTIDGEGTILFPELGGDLIALSPSAGTELWRIDLGPEESVVSTPTIADDGTIYLMTSRGFLAAFGQGCPEPPIQPPFSYRLVVAAGDYIQGIQVGFSDFKLGDDGLVVFLGGAGSASTAFLEKSDGTYDVIKHGDVIDGYTIDQLSLPQRDRQGNVFIPAYVADVGPGIFVNDRLFVAERGRPDLPIRMSRIEDWRYVDHNETGYFTVLGSFTTADPTTLYSVNMESSELTALFWSADFIDNFQLNAIRPEPVDGFGNDRVPVLRVEGGDFAIVEPNVLIARTGEVVDGRRINAPRSPRRNEVGSVYFLDGGNAFQHAPDGTKHFVHGVGDTVAGQYITEIRSAATNDLDDVAYEAVLLASRGVFLNEVPVWVYGVTELDTRGQEVGGNDRPKISLNDRREVAFTAYSGLYVAKYLKFDRDGDADVDSFDLIGTFGCFNTASPSCECVLRADSNRDQAVNCTDWSELKRTWTGPPQFPPLLAICDRDCNANQIADDLEISHRTGRDCNANGLLDDCELAGDSNGDHIVGLSDYAALNRNFMGPNHPASCSIFDADRDNDVDLIDFAGFQRSFGVEDQPGSAGFARRNP